MKSAKLARAAYKLGTSVVLVTVNGAVPVATLLTKKLAVIFPAVAKLPEVVVPVTPNEDSVPTLVIFGCAAAVTVPATLAVATVKLATVVVLVTTNGAVPDASVLVICPVALTVVNAPVFAVVAPTVPLCAQNNRAFTLPAVMFPVTANADSVPTEVIFGCAAVVTVPAVVANGTVPVTFAPGIPVKPVAAP